MGEPANTKEDQGRRLEAFIAHWAGRADRSVPTTPCARRSSAQPWVCLTLTPPTTIPRLNDYMFERVAGTG